MEFIDLIIFTCDFGFTIDTKLDSDIRVELKVLTWHEYIVHEGKVGIWRLENGLELAAFPVCSKYVQVSIPVHGTSFENGCLQI